MRNLKKLISFIVVVVFLVVFAIWMFSSDLEHIEDTNGATFQLQQITDSNIINMDIGALNVSKTKTPLSETEYSSDKFTGVYDFFTTDIVGNRFDVTLFNTVVNSGNFKVVLIHNDEIVHEFKLNELMQTYTLENPHGAVSLRIAGESADFEFAYSTD